MTPKAAHSRRLCSPSPPLCPSPSSRHALPSLPSAPSPHRARPYSAMPKAITRPRPLRRRFPPEPRHSPFRPVRNKNNAHMYAPRRAHFPKCLTSPLECAMICKQKTFGTEKYPRGRRGSPAKGVVRVNRSQGSNPCFSASQNLNRSLGLGSFLCLNSRRDLQRLFYIR